MARRPRIDIPGYHHIINRGVNRTDVFSDDSDKEKFLQIVCKACRIYDVILHDYCLMDNHYHLLVENRSDNLSLFMRQINANYAIYFNKRTNRTGHLWQGRYSSWYILGSDYLYSTIKYIEHNPIEAGIVSSIGGYKYTLGSAILRGEDIPFCTNDSILVREYDIRTLSGFLDEPLKVDEKKELEAKRRKLVEVNDKKAKIIEKKPLERYFDKSMDKATRNRAIYEAYMDGHTQLSISKHLGMSNAAISIIVKKFNI